MHDELKELSSELDKLFGKGVFWQSQNYSVIKNRLIRRIVMAKPKDGSRMLLAKLLKLNKTFFLKTFGCDEEYHELLKFFASKKILMAVCRVVKLKLIPDFILEIERALLL